MPYLACHSCGTIRHTNPKATLCVKCITAKRRREFYAAFKLELESRGYTLHTGEEAVTGNKVPVQVTNHACGHTFIAQLRNLHSGATICGTCGPKKRMAYAQTHWQAKYGRDYDVKVWDDYLMKVRALSDKLYKANIDLLNPDRHPRSRPDLNPAAWQLDHIVPIIECFKQGWTVEQAASISNLQMLPALENLSKQRFPRGPKPLSSA